MKYTNATKILPMELIYEIQKYISGEILYIPQKEEVKSSWGSISGARQEIMIRNNQIRIDKISGKSIEHLMNDYNLSYDTIKKIVYSK